MAAQIDVGARASCEEHAGSLMVQASSPDHTAGGDGDSTTDFLRSPQKDSSVLEQLMKNLMLALGAPHV